MNTTQLKHHVSDAGAKPPVSDSTVKPPVSKQQVLELRRSHTLSEVAALTGVPINTVKTWCARSGAFKDNPRHRAMFTLPEIQTSSGTELMVPELPPQSVVTGDSEIDAVLWLREVIKTGQVNLITKAMEAAKRIKTPLKDLEDRYLKLLVSKNPGDWTVMFKTMGFTNLEGLAETSAAKLTLRHEGASRFGGVDNLFASTPAEQFCIDALSGLKPSGKFGDLDVVQVDKRFQSHSDLLPHTLSDCLHELAYWDDMCRLREAFGTGCGDPGREPSARESFAFRSLARIRPKTKPEAVAVFRWLADSERMEDKETEGILLNLIG